MLVLGLDFETTGLNFKRDRVTEIGAVLWDVHQKMPIEFLSTLVFEDSYPRISQEASEVSGIETWMIKKYGKRPKDAFNFLVKAFEVADFVVAHNAPFDRGFLFEECKRQNITCPRLRWIDTATDVPYPNHITTRKLSRLAELHDIENPCPHRAVFDAFTMIQVMNRYDFKTVTKWARSRNVVVEAELDPSEKERAENHGYRFNRRFSSFRKKIKEFLVEDEKAKSNFPVHIINQDNSDYRQNERGL